MREFLNVALGKFRVPMQPSDCRAYPDSDLFDKALQVRDARGFGFHDSLIVAAAMRAGCSVLYTEDLQHGRQREGVTITNPF